MSAHINLWPTVDAFADIMKSKLDANIHKGPDGSWRKAMVKNLLEMLEQEICELKEKIITHGNVPQGYRTTDALENDIAVEVGRECADVANYAMMIADTMCQLTLMAESEQDSSIMPSVELPSLPPMPDVVPAPKSIAQRLSELTISKPDPEDIPF